MHNNTLRRVSTHASTTTTSSRITPSIHTRRSTDSRILEQVLQDGDEIGPGRFLLDQPISVVHARSDVVPNLRVLRKLATGSYAVVYLVQEIVPPTTASNFLNLSEDDESPPLTPAATAAPAQGRLFALKCLEKHAQDQEAQLLEATIHQSLPVHQNIVTLWSTLETESYLLLVLDYVPGEDLFYFLEQFRDYDESHLDRDGSSPTSSAPPISTAGLAWLQPSQLLSYHRLRLVASMFSQMCEAVAHCHRHGVFHRDIKPENFMVTDTRILDPVTGEYKRSVTVKLTDFGLATRDPESGDMDCGSAPYMSFECRNFITPMYATAPADVWSLGIVLLNMLYHANPWMSSAFGACQSFDSFLREPIPFFMDRFPGMTPAVAEFFARRVFCLLEVPSTGNNSGSMSPLSPHYANNVGRRITAEEFGLWARDLQLHLGPSARRTPALAFQPTPSPIPSSSTPNSRPRSPGETSLTSTTRLMAPSVSQPGTRTPSPSVHARPPVPVHPATAHNGNNGDTPYQSDSEEEDVGRSRTTSSKRRKRAPRGNKAQTTPTTPATSTATTAPSTQHLSSAAEYAATIRAISTSNDDRLRELATRSEMVAREASKLTKTPPSTTAPLHTTTSSAPIINPPTSTVTTARSTPELRTKRSTKWTDIFRRDSGSDQEVPTSAQIAQMDAERESLSSPVQALPPATLPSSASVGNLSIKQTGTAKNVSNLLKSLDSTAPASNPASTVRSGDVLDDGISWSGNSNGRSSSFSSRGRRKERRGGDRESQRAPSPGSIFSVSTTSTANSTSNRNRGQSAPNHDRRTRSKSPTQAALEHFNMLMPTSGDSAPPAVSPSGHAQRLVYVPESPPPPVPIVPEEHRGFVPVPAQVQQQQVDVPPAAGQSNRRSYAPSIASVSTTTTSSSAFTAFSGKNSRWGRYSNSNASVRSVSTAATSVSSSSTNWRNEANPPLPSNIKPMKGIPKELDQLPQLPRHMQSRPKDNSRNRRRPPSAPTSPTPGSSFGLDTISEKPKKSAMKQPKAPAPPLPSSSYEEPVNPGLQRLNDAIRGSEFGGFDPSIKPFGRGGPGLQIDPEIANAALGYPAGANVAVPPHPQNVENVPERPAKTPTRSRLWSWRR